jgi:hypothetical protein
MRFIDGYLPRAGDAFDFVQADAGIAGQFAAVVFPDVEPGFETELTVSEDGKLRLTAINDAVAIGSAAQPAFCGAGLCGPGIAPMTPLSMICLAAARRHLRTAKP